MHWSRGIRISERRGWRWNITAIPTREKKLMEAKRRKRSIGFGCHVKTNKCISLLKKITEERVNLFTKPIHTLELCKKRIIFIDNNHTNYALIISICKIMKSLKKGSKNVLKRGKPVVASKCTDKKRKTTSVTMANNCRKKLVVNNRCRRQIIRTKNMLVVNSTCHITLVLDSNFVWKKLAETVSPESHQ